MSGNRSLEFLHKTAEMRSLNESRPVPKQDRRKTKRISEVDEGADADTSETLEDVIASDNVVRIQPDDMQSHFFAWDRSGKPAVIEWLDGKMKVFRGDTLPIPVINNSSYESCVESGDDPMGRFKTIVDGLNAFDAAQSGDYQLGCNQLARATQSAVKAGAVAMAPSSHSRLCDVFPPAVR